MNMSEDRQFLTIREAIALLDDGDEIHVFCNPQAGTLLGADWSRKEVLDAIEKASFREVTGPMAQKVNHGLAIANEHGQWFIKTKKPKP